MKKNHTTNAVEKFNSPSYAWGTCYGKSSPHIAWKIISKGYDLKKMQKKEDEENG